MAETKSSKVKVFIPKDPLNAKSDSLFVAVNGENIRIKRGETVEVDPKFAEVIERSQKTADEADKKATELTQNNP